jgi:signal transduction histidine kinase
VNAPPVSEVNFVTSTIAAISGLLIAYSVWSHRRQQAGAGWFMLLVLAVSWVSFCYAFEAVGGSDLGFFLTASKFEYLALTTIPVFWLGFTLGISGYERPFSTRTLVLLLAIPVITVTLVFTNEWHGLVWKRPLMQTTPYGPVYTPEYGIWFWVYAVYAYVPFIAGTVVLVRHTLKAWSLYRAQAILVLVGTVFPWVSNFLEIFDQLNPLPALQLNSVCLTIAITTYAVGVFRMRLLDITPMSEDAILNHMPVGFVVTDSQNRVVALNQNMEPYFNVRDAIGHPLASLLPALPVPKPGETQPQFWPFRQRVIEVTTTPVLNWRKQPRGTLYVLNDVTSRVQAEDARRSIEDRQRALLTAIPDTMFRIRQDGTYLDYHAGDPGDLFLAPEAFLNRKISEILPEPVADLLLRTINEVLATGSIGTVEYSLDIRGVRLDFEARIVASGADEVVSIVRNVTDSKEAERRAFALALEKERVTLLTRFIQESSHEFRTPLSTIEVNLHLMKRGVSPEMQAQRVEQIHVQVARISRLVDMLVQMSRLESGLPLALRPVAPNEVASQVALNMQTAAKRKGLSVRTLLSEALPNVDADPKQLMEALTQILDNAVRYTPEDGGSISLSTGLEGDQVVFTIEDNGLGIPDDAHDRIFERFFRMDTAHSTPGFGLGLPIAQRIIELHGGTISVESEVGVGSRFRIALPRSQVQETVLEKVMH